MSLTVVHGRELSSEFLEGEPEHDTPLYGVVQTDISTAAKWASDNKVNVAGPGSPIARINTARFEAGLPMFDILPGRSASSTSNRKPVQVAPTPRVLPALVPSSPAPDPSMYFDPSLRVIKSEGELLDLVTSHDGTISVMCTPELAGFLMALNTGNRPKHERNVDRFCEIIRSGAWVNTGEPVIVAKEGQLNDGQHRLDAVRITGIPVPMDLRFGISRDAFKATNTGARRTLGNVLAIAGHQNSTLLAATARLLHHYDRRSMASSTQQVEAHLLLSIIDGEPLLPQVVGWVTRCRFKPVRVSPFALGLVVAARAAGIERTTSFAATVASGIAEETDPARRLHVRLQDAAFRRERLHQTDVAALTIRAWNSWIQGRPMQQLRITEADRTSAGFPVALDPSSVARGNAA